MRLSTSFSSAVAKPARHAEDVAEAGVGRALVEAAAQTVLGRVDASEQRTEIRGLHEAGSLGLAGVGTMTAT